MAKWQASKSDVSPRKGYIPDIENDDDDYPEIISGKKQANYDHEDFSDADPDKLVAEHPIDFLNKHGIKHTRGKRPVVDAPKDRSGDTSRRPGF